MKGASDEVGILLPLVICFAREVFVQGRDHECVLVTLGKQGGERDRVASVD